VQSYLEQYVTNIRTCIDGRVDVEYPCYRIYIPAGLIAVGVGLLDTREIAER
jgi:hypothetical protein